VRGRRILTTTGTSPQPQGGPVILTIEVPDDIVARALNEWFPLSQGLVQFDAGAGLEELLAAWPSLEKRIPDI
jgi:hypothetical protein